MISEAAITGKPIYVAQMPSIKSNQRFREFFNLFESLKIIKNLEIHLLKVGIMKN